MNIIKRKYFGVKATALIVIALGLVFDLICGKENGVSIMLYILGATIFLMPAKWMEMFGLE